MDQEQEAKLAQEEIPAQETNQEKKNGKVKWIIGLTALLLMVMVVVLCTRGESDEGKDVYELFPWGTKIETVFKKLDELNINYDYDASENLIKFSCSEVQGSDRNGEARLYFGESGILKELYVTIVFSYTRGRADADYMAAQMAIIMLTLTGKYGEPIEYTDYNTSWESKSWIITIGQPYAFGEEIRGSMSFSKK